MPVTVAELFPTNVRASGISLGLNIAASIFGGIAPLIATFLIKITGVPITSSIYLIVCAVIGLATIICLSRRNHLETNYE